MMINFFKNKKTNEVVMGMKKGEDWMELKANSTDAAKEKHVPVVEANGKKVTVKVGSVAHPMTPEHHIVFICLVTNKKNTLKNLDPTGKPEAEFELAEGEKVVEVYEYCNLHGLWVYKA
jgi:superoxide reductase